MTDAQKITFSVTKGTKTGTITITDTNGDGKYTNADSVRFNGDTSVFSKEDINRAVTASGFVNEGNIDTKSQTEAKDGKVSLKADQEYSLGSLAKSLGATSASTPQVQASLVPQLQATEDIYKFMLPALSVGYIDSIGTFGELPALLAYQTALSAFTTRMLGFLSSGSNNVEPAKTTSPATTPTATEVVFEPASAAAPAAATSAPATVAASTEASAPAAASAEDQEKAKLFDEGKSLGVVWDSHDTLDSYNNKVAIAKAEKEAKAVANEAQAVTKRGRINESLVALGGFLDAYEKNQQSGYGFVSLRAKINEIREVLDKNCAELDALHVQNPKEFTDTLSAVRARLAKVPTEAQYKQQVAEKAAVEKAATERTELTAIINPIDRFLNGSYKTNSPINYDVKKKDEKEGKVIELIDTMDRVLDGKMVVDRTWFPEKTAVLEKYLKELATIEFECSSKLKTRIDTFRAKLAAKADSLKPAEEKQVQAPAVDSKAAPAPVKKPPITDATKKLLAETYSVQMKELGFKLENIKSEKVGQEALTAVKAQAAKDEAAKVQNEKK